MTPGTYCVPRNRQEWEAILRLADSLGLLWKPFKEIIMNKPFFLDNRYVAITRSGDVAPQGRVAFLKDPNFMPIKGFISALYDLEAENKGPEARGVFMDAMMGPKESRPIPETKQRPCSLDKPPIVDPATGIEYCYCGCGRQINKPKLNVPRLTVEARLENLEGAFDLHLQEHRNSKRTISVSDPEDTGEKRFGSTTITFPPEVKITGGYPTGKCMIAIDPKASPTNIPFEIALAYLKAGRKVRRDKWDPCTRIEPRGPGAAGGLRMIVGDTDTGEVLIQQANLLATDWMVLPE